MMSTDKLMSEMLNDIAAETAAAAAADPETPPEEKDVYTRAEVDALILEKMKELKEGITDGSKEEGSGADGAGADTKGGEENE